MSEKRSPVIRKPTPAEELEKLHPVERVLLRVFEFLASLKLAITLMAWLMLECTIGTFIESQVNTPAAKYFVYGSGRFMLLLALLGLNVLCAALIRFPWKRYQTGFLVTHAGLLTILAGSMITALNSVDALMPVKQGESENKIYDPDDERIAVAYHDREGGVKELKVPLQPGPFTWGHRLWGYLPWRENYQEEYRLENGDLLRIKQYYANCTAENIYIPSSRGVPAVRYRLYHPERVDMTQWIAADEQGMMGSHSLMLGSLTIWQLDTEAELEHFVHAVPKDNDVGLLGAIGYSHAGKHYHYRVDQLQKGPMAVPGTSITLELIQYLPNAKVKDRRELVNDDTIPEPRNPVVRIRVRDSNNQKGDTELMAFGAHPEFGRLLTRNQGHEHLLSFFPADQPAVIHLAMTKNGRLGYRAFGSQGLIASAVVAKDQNYPSWAGWQFTPLEWHASAAPDVLLKPKRLQRGKAGNPGIVVELRSKGESFETTLVRGMRRSKTLGNQVVALHYDVDETVLPFKIQLDSFDEPKNPGTNQAAMYTSHVTLIDESKGIREKKVVTMNYPLYHTDSLGNSYTFYQSGIEYMGGIPISTYTVARDPGLNVKYAGAFMLCVGIFLMFYMGGYFRRSPKPRGGGALEQPAEALVTV